jgi:hypothetical protein
MTRFFPPLRVGTFSALLFVLAVAGCKSASGPGSASFASVIIKKHSPAEIHAAAAEVFQEDGFAAFQVAPDRLVFEKEASRLASMSRDGLVATQAGARTIERVRTELVDLGGGTYRLQCQAYMVSGVGDSFFENEVAKTHMRAGPYRSLMKKIGKKLK